MLALKRLWIQITADRKRFGVLCAMCAVGLLLWARVIIISNMPRTAVADEKKAVSAAPAEVDGGTSEKKRLLEQAVRLSVNPDRDPFVVPEQHFPKPTYFDQFNTDQSKSEPERSEDPEQAEARLVESLRMEVNRFVLEGVMGDSMALIDGTLYRPGGKVPAKGAPEIEFTLTELKHRSVVLDYEGRRFELRMAPPGVGN